jgi:hypothetical protein
MADALWAFEKATVVHTPFPFPIPLGQITNNGIYGFKNIVSMPSVSKSSYCRKSVDESPLGWMVILWRDYLSPNSHIIVRLLKYLQPVFK